MPLPLHYNSQGSYVYIKPRDTVLILSYEYLKADSNMAGTFHSRVRTSASGLGSISTTLDPKWNGMLLFSVNNPTKKKIKIPVTENKDGKTERCSIITLVVFRNSSEICKDNLSLQLDNPPMRADIWTELTAPPNRLFNNKKYHKFQNFIKKLVNFKVDESENRNKIDRIIELILELKVSLKAKKSIEKTKESLMKLDYEIPEDYIELREKLTVLSEKIKTSTLEELLENKLIDNTITLMKKECEYMILSDEVEQINAFVHKNIEEWWEYGWFVKVFNDYIMPNIGAFLGTAILFAFLFFGLNQEADSTIFKSCIALLPTIISFMLNFLKDRKGEKKK